MFSYKLPDKLKKQCEKKIMIDNICRKEAILLSQKKENQNRNTLLIKRNLYKIGKILGIEEVLSLSPYDHECCNAECRADCRCNCCYGECSNNPPQYHIPYSDLDHSMIYKIEKIFSPLEKSLKCEYPECNHFKRLKNLKSDDCIINNPKNKTFTLNPIHRTCSLTCYRKLKEMNEK